MNVWSENPTKAVAQTKVRQLTRRSKILRA